MERAHLLFRQGRLDLAEVELRAALAAEPENAMAHALLSQCLSDRKQYPEATREAQEAVRLAPDLDIAHYALARGLLGRERLGEAEAAIKEALRLGPRDPDFHALLGWIRLAGEDREGALAAAEEGMGIEPDHVDCANLRAQVLVLLGRRQEAGAAIEGALAREPDNAVTHANQGWALLHRAEYAVAVDHFREALRLDPELEWAREGLVEALKAHHPLYGLMLRWSLWMTRLSPRTRWAVVIGGYLGYQAVLRSSGLVPGLRAWVMPALALYLAFCILTWIADPLFNLVLRLHPTGRWALSRDELAASNWVGGCLIAGVTLGGLGLAGGDPDRLIPAGMLLMLAHPVAAVFRCPAGRPRLAMAAYAALMAGAALAWLVLPVGGGAVPVLGFLVGLFLTDRVADALARM